MKKIGTLLFLGVCLLIIPAQGEEPQPAASQSASPDSTADTLLKAPPAMPGKPIKSEIEETDPVLDARHDASREVSRLKWTACGCVGLYFGVGASLLFVGSPREDRLVGKSSDYVFTYMRNYRKYARQNQFRSALVGCATTTCMASMIIVFVAATSADGCGPDLSCGLSDECNTMNNCATSTNNCMNSSNNCSGPNCGSGCGSSSSSCGSATSRAAAEITAP